MPSMALPPPESRNGEGTSRRRRTGCLRDGGRTASTAASAARSGNDPSRQKRLIGFPHCLRGELTGSRRRASTHGRSLRPISPGGDHGDPHRVPLAGCREPGDSARGSASSDYASGLARPRAGGGARRPRGRSGPAPRPPGWRWSRARCPWAARWLRLDAAARRCGRAPWNRPATASRRGPPEAGAARARRGASTSRASPCPRRPARALALPAVGRAAAFGFVAALGRVEVFAAVAVPGPAPSALGLPGRSACGGRGA